MNHTERRCYISYSIRDDERLQCIHSQKNGREGCDSTGVFTLDLLSVYDALGLNSKNGFGANSREDSLQKAKERVSVCFTPLDTRVVAR